MKVKKYTGASMQEVMNHIRAELGHNAVILSSKMINRNGFLGLFKKKTFEVVATIDEDLVDSKKTTYTKVNIESIPHIKRESSEPTVSYKNEEVSSSKEIMKELHSMKQMLTLDSKYNLYPEILKEIHQKLVSIELDKQLIDKLMEYLLNKWRNDSSSAEMTRELLLRLVHSYLHEQVKGLSGNKEQLFRRKYINIVGPTGVGKTTTIAKVAAEYVLKHNKQIAFITTDTYRIAAIEQLKTYAEILNIPVEVAYNSEDFKQAAKRFAHYDYVFIDTAGRNYQNKEFVVDLKCLIDFDIDVETYLVLSATSKENDMDIIYNQFSIIPIKGVIFTKIDETANRGMVLNFIIKHQIPLIYMTNGQDVPDDIMVASNEEIIKTVCGGHLYA